MGQRPSATRTRLSRRPARPGGIANCIALPPLLALSAFLAWCLHVMHAHALGEDGAPGGSGCDEDVVVWFDAETAHVSLDARESPDEWR